MKHLLTFTILLLIACAIALYFFLTTTTPWIFWVATAVLLASAWWSWKQWKKRQNKD